MDVNTLRDRVVALSHDEAAPDTNLKTQALGWLNNAYRELMDELQPFLEPELMVTQTVTTLGNGTVTLPPIQRILQVVDTTHAAVLQQTSPLLVREIDPSLTATGAPRRYWLEGQVLTVHPVGEVTLEILALPLLTDLSEGGLESSILLPAAYHHALVWGALVWATVYERGFSSQGDLTLFQQKWDDAKQRIKLSLLTKPDRLLRTQPGMVG